MIEGFALKTIRPLNKLIGKNTSEITEFKPGRKVNICAQYGPPITVSVADEEHVQSEHGTTWAREIVNECPRMFSVVLPFKRRIFGVEEHIIHTRFLPDKKPQENRQERTISDPTKSSAK
jgi:hypothetical protein